MGGGGCDGRRWVQWEEVGAMGGGGCDNSQGNMHMVIAKLDCERVMVRTGWATSHQVTHGQA